MRVCTAWQMATIDAETIAGGITGLELMERAGKAMVGHLLEFLEDLPSGKVLILCGQGNNGGDGLVMARLLCEVGFSVEVMMLADSIDLKGDSAVNYARLPARVNLLHPPRKHWLGALKPLLKEVVVVVDAIFGTGVTLPLHQPYVDLISAVNNSDVPTVSVDIPSGVNGDDGRVNPVAMDAELTITVGLPKRGLLLAPGRDFVGDLEVIDIGFPKEICLKNSSNHHCLAGDDYLEMLPPRPTQGHKYNFGRVTVLAGSRAYGGAAHLAGMGALRSGVGLVKMAVPMELVESTRVLLPEAVIVGLATSEAGTIDAVPQAMMKNLLSKQQAVVLGPGLDSDPVTDAWVVDFLARLELPVVVDADALNAFTRLGVKPYFRSPKVILTPHAGELAGMCGLNSDEVIDRRFDLVPELAARWQVVLMLKGSPSIIAEPGGKLFYNSSGDDALARGGSGDVLSGLIGGLLAQGKDPLDAVLLGAYIHGVAGSVAASSGSSRSVLVRETAQAIGPVFGAMEEEANGHPELRQLIRPLQIKEN